MVDDPPQEPTVEDHENKPGSDGRDEEKSAADTEEKENVAYEEQDVTYASDGTLKNDDGEEQCEPNVGDNICASEKGHLGPEDGEVVDNEPDLEPFFHSLLELGVYGAVILNKKYVVPLASYKQL
ncbi:uncharacterized protein LAESUDRAFT_715506 [Laetiporus sulphureus 93-53]|uniref:Uncharacterized protein n=1 Tax=Laetiporus sulphureus 93-53 TaxID=1314785 RepID=A0A165DAR4_9APHY|nr:uncharacterized protein LAESUDRAFT_715506 [Laetiporus sulphureus 93-53]KZT04448.1 hypothetical protein LAESUDRAFT_715506 [Laetiporus sulphureus 93-53]